jgi:predicted transcriptional regulator
MILEKTASIVSAYVGRNDLPPDSLTGLIREVYQTLSAPEKMHLAPERRQEIITVAQPQLPVKRGPGRPSRAEKEAQNALEAPQQPAVDPRKSVFKDYIICLEDGKKLKMLKRHLATSFNLSPDEYREKWGLGPEYPMVAPQYAERRSQLAKSNGLGRRAAPERTERKRATA